MSGEKYAFSSRGDIQTFHYIMILITIKKKALAVRLPSWPCFKSLFSKQGPCDFLHEVTPGLLQRDTEQGMQSDRGGEKEGAGGGG